jgi:hypothetical protein
MPDIIVQAFLFAFKTFFLFIFSCVITIPTWIVFATISGLGSGEREGAKRQIQVVLLLTLLWSMYMVY